MARILNGEQCSFVAYIEFAPGAQRLRGNHYHVEKTETLYIITGALNATYYDLDTEEKREETLHAGDLVTIRPRCVHVYVPLEYSQALELAANPYDAKDTITYDLSEMISQLGKGSNS